MVKVKLSSYKNKLFFTIPVKLIRELNAKIGDYIKINIKKDSHDFTYYSKIPKIPNSRTNLQLRRAVPKIFVDKINMKKDDELELFISLVENIRSSDLIINNNYIDILAAIPEKTENGKLIMVDSFRRSDEEWCKIWCCNGHGGTIKLIELRRFIKIDKKLGEFFGLMQAESSKKGGHFSFTNKFLSEIELFVKVVALFGILKKEWKYVLYHRPFIDTDNLNKFINNFSKRFRINKEKITLVKNVNLLDVIHNIYISSTLLREIMISLLIKIRRYIANSEELSFYLKEFSKGFILKDLLGDGTVVINKNSRGLDINISEQDLTSQKDIINILRIFNIKSKVNGIKIYISTNFKSCIWFLKNKAFLEHEKNRYKLLSYINTNFYFNTLYYRLKDFDKCSIKEFSVRHNLSYNAAQRFLSRSERRDYLNKISKATYEISCKGIDFVKLLNKLKLDYPLMTQSGATRTTLLPNPI